MQKILFITLLVFSSYSIAFDAVLSKLNGDVYIDNKKAKKGDSLAIGHKVEARGEKSFFIVQYNNGTKFVVRNGALIIKKLEKKKSNIELLKGILSVSVEDKANQSFDVQTKNAVMGVRGTKFWVKESDEDSYLCVCEGVVAVVNDKSEVLVKRNEDTHVKNGEKIKVTQASQDMWSMAMDDMNLLGVKVKPLEGEK